MTCQWYQNDFCVNADCPCCADYCPCTEYPEICKYAEENSEKEQPHSCDIKEITLLSIEEYQKYKNLIPLVDDWWWLRSPSHNPCCAIYILADGSVAYNGDYAYYNDDCVRPALIINNLESEIGSRIELSGYTWTVLDKNLVLCDETVARRRFDPENNNNWETSELKHWLETKFLEKLKNKEK